MIVKKIDEKTMTENDDEYQMVCVSKQDTGLPCDLWLDSFGKDGKGTRPLPHVDVRMGGRSIAVYLPKDAAANAATVNAVKEYAKAYAKVIAAHYDRLITDKQALTLLLKIEQADDKLVIDALWKA